MKLPFKVGITGQGGFIGGHLFNFLGTGLEVSRKKSLENGINLANFSSEYGV